MILKYFSIFIAILLLGSMADVPVMFLGLKGEISLYFIFIIGFLTDLFSDILWYWLGHKIGIRRFEHIRFFKQNPERMRMVSRALDKYGMLMLYSSKFIYYLGIPTQIVAGAHNYPKKKFMLANVLGAGSILIMIYAFASLFTSEVVVERYLQNAKIAFVLFIVVVVCFNLFLSKRLSKLLTPKNAK